MNFFTFENRVFVSTYMCMSINVCRLPVVAASAGDLGLIPVRRSPEYRRATHSIICAWEISWTEGAYVHKSMGSAKESDMT